MESSQSATKRYRIGENTLASVRPAVSLQTSRGSFHIDTSSQGCHDYLPARTLVRRNAFVRRMRNEGLSRAAGRQHALAVTPKPIKRPQTDVRIYAPKS